MTQSNIPYALRRYYSGGHPPAGAAAVSSALPLKGARADRGARMKETLTDAALALPVVILLISFTLPPEMSISLGSLRLSPYRICLMIYLFPALMCVIRRQEGGFCLPDFCIFLHGIWATLALIVNMGMADGIESGGIYFIETFGAYILARAYVPSVRDYRDVVFLIFKIAAVLLAFAALESLSGHHLIRNIFKAVLGGAGPHYIEPRLGLTRAFTSFEHPILFGVFSASAFAGTYYVVAQGRLCFATLKKLSVIMGATFFSLSGGPYTALALQIGLIAWDKITKGIKGRWYILLSILSAAWVVLTLLSNRSPILVFISYLTFSARSAYNRVHIWDYGTAEVARHPLFGIGLNDWIRAPWMSSSMDNYWLLTTVRYGVPAFIFMLLAIILIIKAIHPRKAPNGLLKNGRKAFVVMLLGFALSGLTVHFWNALMVQFFFFLGCGLGLRDQRSSSVSSIQPQNERRSRHGSIRYYS